MKFIFRYSFYLIFFSNYIYSQEILVKSKKDSTNVAFATINYYKNDSIIGGTYSDKNGIAIIDYKNDFDKIYVSHIGFFSSYFDINSLNEKVIYLEEKVLELSEVIIHKKEIASNWLGNSLNKKNIFISAHRGFEMATLIKSNSNLSRKKIKSLKFNIKRRKEKYSAVLKINFYESINDSLANLINEKQDVSVIIDSKSKGEIVVDLEKYNFYIPKDGVYVSIEWLGLIDTNGSLLQNDTYNDCSIGFNIVNQDSLTFVRNKLSKLAWNKFNFKFDNNNNFYLPAFSLEIY